MAGINYQCNVQHPTTGEDNLGCGKIFESLDDLPPNKRMCPDCRAKADKPVGVTKAP